MIPMEEEEKELQSLPDMEMVEMEDMVEVMMMIKEDMELLQEIMEVDQVMVDQNLGPDNRPELWRISKLDME